MDAYIGLETVPGSQNALYKVLKERELEAYRTLGAHDVICRLPAFASLDDFRKTIDSILFTTEKNKPMVQNTTSYLIMTHHRKKTEKKPTAFCFVRSGMLPSRGKFDKMVTDVLAIPPVIAVSVVIGLFDLICEVVTKNVAELKAVVDKILTTPGVSPRATMICIVVGTQGARTQDAA